ncbi:MAG: hypothetical protein AB1742_02410, partial [bacterium]
CKSDHAKINMRETPWSAVCKHRLVSRAPRGSEGGDDSPQSKACLPAGRRMTSQSIVTKNVRKFTRVVLFIFFTFKCHFDSCLFN